MYSYIKFVYVYIHTYIYKYVYIFTWIMIHLYIYIYVCMYLCIYTHKCWYIWTYIYVYIYICTYWNKFTYKCIYYDIYVWTKPYRYICIYMYVYIYIYIYIYIYVQIYIYIVYIHTCVYIYIYIQIITDINTCNFLMFALRDCDRAVRDCDSEAGYTYTTHTPSGAWSGGGSVYVCMQHTSTLCVYKLKGPPWIATSETRDSPRQSKFVGKTNWQFMHCCAIQYIYLTSPRFERNFRRN